jgi:hypothetical protein
MIDVQRPGTVAARVVEPHQEPVGLLPQGVLSLQLLGDADCLGNVALRLE